MAPHPATAPTPGTAQNTVPITANRAVIGSRGFGYNFRMAIQHQSTKVCDYLIQALDGRFTLAGILSNVYAAELPLARPLGVYVEFSGSVGDPFRITLEGPEEAGQPLMLAEGAVEKPTLRHPQEQWTATIGGMVGMQFPQQGVYRIVLRSGDTVVHEYPFGVLSLASETTPV